MRSAPLTEAAPASASALGEMRGELGDGVRNAHLERLLRKAVKAGDATEIQRLVRKGAIGDVKGRNGQDAIDLVKDIEDSNLRIRCRWALMAKDIDEYFEKYPVPTSSDE